MWPPWHPATPATLARGAVLDGSGPDWPWASPEVLCTGRGCQLGGGCGRPTASSSQFLRERRWGPGADAEAAVAAVTPQPVLQTRDSYRPPAQRLSPGCTPFCLL